MTLAAPPVESPGEPEDPGSPVTPLPSPTGMASLVALVAANAIPLLGVVFLHWQVFPVILIYWLENVAVGGFNVLRIAVADPDQPLLWFAKLFMIPFFCLHFGMFTYIHGVFVFTMFGDAARALGGHSPWPTVALVRLAVQRYGVGFAVLALFMSHAASFVWNYILRGEFRRVKIAQLMTQPYERVMVMHFTIIFGGMATMAMGSPAAAVAVLVVIKTAIDVRLHRRERTRLGVAMASRPVSRVLDSVTIPAG